MLIRINKKRRLIFWLQCGLGFLGLLLAGCWDGPVDLRGRVVSGGGGPGRPGEIVASAGGGKPAGPTEVGTVRGAGGPAAGPEGPVRTAEPPVERPQPPAGTPTTAPARFDLAETIKDIQKQAQGALPLQASGSYQPLPTGRIPVAALPVAAEAEALVGRLNDGSAGAQVSRFGKLELVDPQGRTLVLEQKPVEGPAGSTRWEVRKLSIHLDRQGKHILGHKNFINGNSILRADPEQLVKKMGTGQQVGELSIGEPGSKERIVYDFIIGDFVDPVNGHAAPTTVGIVHYSKNGVHIVPGRPVD